MHAANRRLFPVDPASLNAEQQDVVTTLCLNPAAIQEPVGLLLHNPSLAEAIYPVLTRLRNRSVLSDNLRELATLIVAQVWQQGFEWQAHEPLALAAGLKKDLIEAVSRGEWPPSMDPEEEVVHDFCRQLHETKFVDDEVYRRAELLLGSAGVLELCWLSGSYASLAMVMNVAGSPPSWTSAAPS